ncbi:bifunctional glucose-1-phosphatase/inositol phosphatase [Orbaceae bacterium ESL0727]|nr:bifunctional glucose-1-phosphatase/inositol phosphatase [Orbaceae bacterium ESL0727]
MGVKSKYRQVAIALSLLLSTTMVEASEKYVDNYSLEQVVIFSRHGLRAPLATPSSALGKITSHQWPQWDTPASYLTTRGGALESYFGHYLDKWLVDNKLLKDNECPTEKDVYFYANSMQRTIATAQYLAIGAFPGCIVPVYHKEKLNTMDPLFSLNITDGSEKFKQEAIASITQAAGEGGINGLNQRLKPIYQNMSKIIDYLKSVTCTVDKKCDFMAQDAAIKIVEGQEPGISGPLKTGTSISDAFILQYYEGAPLKDIAWGQIKSQKQFEQLVSVKEYYNSVIFAAPVIAKHVAKNLLSYIDDTFTQSDNKAKVTFLIGHDSNVASIFSALGIKTHKLPNQFETTPIGGKILFEKWKDNTTGKNLLKIQYFYQSTKQLTNMEPLTNTNPPQIVTLEMKNCPVNADGFCDFDSFINQLNEIIK